ncbi:sterile alpha motif domain-containing protein 3-like [Engraulis encrasicolus]|uniref:sterile alpha motif domain-containing protein 3-like n=1 Tax=Engraulis encrasicolus TaxID=184585 RepID=UPI002FD76486
MVDKWSQDNVGKWLQSINLIDFKETFREQEIDGETLLGLTERMIEKLFPVIKLQVLFMKELQHLKNSSTSEPVTAAPCNGPCDQQGPLSHVTEPWPAVFCLPDFPPELKAALLRKDPAFKKKDKSHLRALLIQVLFDNITKHTWYPSHKMYGDVLGTLTMKYPFLKDGSSSGHATLLECLRNKFKKERRPLLNSALVEEMKVKYGSKKRTSAQMTDCHSSTQMLAKRRGHPPSTVQPVPNSSQERF